MKNRFSASLAFIALAALLAPLEADPKTAAVCSKLLLPDGRLNSAGGYVTAVGYAHELGFGELDDGRWDKASDVGFSTATAAAYLLCAV